MKKNVQKTIAVLGAAVLATGMVGCGSSNTNTSAADTSADSSAAESGAAADTTENSADAADLSGSITLAGSTSMEKFANALAETFMEKYPNVTVQAEFTGSSAGIESVLAGQCDVGDSSRALKDDEKAKGAVENIVAIDGIAVVVDPSNAVDGLSKDDLTGIYDGSITNWKDVGGKDQEIVAFQRGEDSGSQTLFKKLLIQGRELMTPPSELAPAAMGELVDSIADYNNSANAIGFSVYYYIDQMYSKPGLRLLAVDGVTPSNDTLADGSYPLCNDFYAVIHPDAAADSPERRLYDWLDTNAGQDCIKKSGYVAVGPQTTVTIVD